jgi:hypothetical protein
MGLASLDTTCQGTIVSATPPSGTGGSAPTGDDVCVYTATATGTEAYCCGCAQVIAGNGGYCPQMCAPLCFAKIQACASANCPSACAGIGPPPGGMPVPPSCAQCVQAKCPAEYADCAAH